MLLNCIKRLGKQISSADRAELEDAFSAHTAKGLSEYEASMAALTGYHKNVFNAVNELRVAASLKPVEYKAYVASQTELSKLAVNESPETMRKKAEMVNQAKVPVMLYNPGQEVLPHRKGLVETKTKVGIWVFDPSKVSAQQIEAKVADGSYHELLGITEPKSEATDRVVTARAKDGTEIESAAVSPANEAAQAKVYQERSPEATIETGIGENVIRDRVALKPLSTGKESTVSTERGTEVKSQYAIVEAADLVTSHDSVLNRNPGFPEELQPRERDRAASADQINRIAKNIRPEYLGESPKASEGAPITGLDGIVESGNGRVLGLRKAYESGKAGDYRQHLIENAEKFGVDPASITSAKEPVLVRVRQSNVDRAQFVREANEAGVAAMSAPEQAKSDGQRLTGELLSTFSPSESGEINTTANSNFIRAFMRDVVGPNELGRYVSGKGEISQEGLTRIRNAIFARAYGDSPEGLRALEKLAESPDNNVRNITTALLQRAGQFASLKEGIAKGERYPLDVTTDLSKALAKLSSLREQEMSVKDYLNQGDLFGADLTSLQKQALWAFDEYKRSTKAVSAILDNYARGAEAAGNPKQANFFGNETPQKEALFDAAVRETVEDGNRQVGLFATENQRTQIESEARQRVPSPDTAVQEGTDKAVEVKERNVEPDFIRQARERAAKREADKAEGIEYRRSGADPYELIDNITIKGWELYSQKVKPTFAEWSRKLREEFGPESESHLRKVWAQLGGERDPSTLSTAAKREKVTEDRVARGEEPLPRPFVTRKSDERLLADAKAANQADKSEPMRLVDQVLYGKKGALSDKETVQVDLHVQELKNKYDAVNTKLAEAKDTASIKELSEQSDAMEREMRSAEEAFAVSGTEKGRTLRAQRVEIDQDFRLLTMVSKSTKAHGRELTVAERTTIKEQSEKIAELEIKLTEANDRAAKAEAEKAVGRIKSDVARENRRAGRGLKRQSLDQEAAELKSLIAQAWKRQPTGGSEIHSAMGLAKLDPEGVVTKLVVQLARNRVEARVGLKAEALVDEVHGLLKDVVDLSRRDVAEMISGYGKTFELSQEKVDVRLRELKSIIAANLGKADIVEKGIRPLRRGLQRDKPTQEIRAAMRDLRDTLREHGMQVERSKGSPEEQQQSALDAAKTRTKNRIEDLNKWIKDGKRTVANKTETIPDPELKTLQAERDRLQKVFEAIVDPAADLKKIENSLRTVNKSVADLEAKIKAGNIAVKPREAGLTSPELEAARAEQKALRGIISDLRRAAKPQPTDVETEAKRLLSANKALNTRMEKQIADLERRMAQRDFSKPQRREPVPFNRENLVLQKQLEQIKQEYNRANYKATRSRFGQISDELAKAANVPKTIKSMGDISAVFRQGGFYSLTHPVEGFAKPTAAMLRSFTETGFRNVEQAILNHPKYEQAKRDGVEFTGVEKGDPNLSHIEESFFGSETIDVLAKGKYNPLRAVQATKDFSQRTFVSFLDSQRMHMYDLMSEGLKAQGLSPRNSPASYKGIAKLINIGTGRGNLGKTGNQAAPLLNIAMFSPRLVASRVQLLNNMFNPVAMARKPTGVRAQNIKDNVKFLAATSAFMGLATALGGTVSLDPDDADFLKIRFGKTAYDTLTGLQQPLRYIINMARSAVGGETSPGQDKSELTKRFARSKASPSISPIINWIADEDFMGRKFSLKREAGEIVTPLPAKDFWEAMQKEGLVKGFLKATPALTGVGVQTYEIPERPTTLAEKLSRKFVRSHIPDKSRTDEEIELSRQLSTLRARSRKGEDVSGELRGLSVTKRQADGILAAQNKTRLQEDFNHLGPKEALIVYGAATPKEREQILRLLENKVTTSDLKKLRPTEQANIRARMRELKISERSGSKATSFGPFQTGSENFKSAFK